MKAVRCSGSIAARLSISTATGREYALEAAMTRTVQSGQLNRAGNVPVDSFLNKTKRIQPMLTAACLLDTALASDGQDPKPAGRDALRARYRNVT